MSVVHLDGRPKKIIEAIFSMAILLVCCGLGRTLFTRISFPSRAEPLSVADMQLEGQILAAPRGYSWASQPQTLLLAIRTGCRYCEASLPFYKRLSDLEKGGSLHAHVLVVMPDDPISGKNTLRSAGLAPETVFNQPITSLKVSATPTVLLVDMHGRVTKSWVGQLRALQELDVIATSGK